MEEEKNGDDKPSVVEDHEAENVVVGDDDPLLDELRAFEVEVVTQLLWPVWKLKGLLKNLYNWGLTDTLCFYFIN